MNIHLPDELENSIRPLVLSGQFASEDDLVAEAVREFLRQRQPEQGDARSEHIGQAHKPIWEVIEEENRSIPPEVWETLPTDLSEQHDHYIYGTPKDKDA